jgi:hypothetical protein
VSYHLTLQSVAQLVCGLQASKNPLPVATSFVQGPCVPANTLKLVRFNCKLNIQYAFIDTTFLKNKKWDNYK